MAKIDKAYNKDGDAKHYDSERINVMVHMEKIWGTMATMIFCEMNAFKYRSRIGKKEGQSPEQELLKIHWYEQAAKFYQNKMINGEDIPGLNPLVKHSLPWKKPAKELK